MRIFESLDAFAAALGGDIGVSPWMTVDQAMIDAAQRSARPSPGLPAARSAPDRGFPSPDLRSWPP